METLKISFVDFWPEIDQEDVFTPILSKHYNVVLDNNNPDVVFHSVFGGMRNISRYQKAKKILWIAENFRANQFKTDYTVSFDPPTDTNFRLPLWQAYMLKDETLYDKLVNKPKIDKVDFERFCSFTVSNSSNFSRNAIYNSLKSYKMVHSYGRFLTNSFELQHMMASNKEYWRVTKGRFFDSHTHKFSICYENSYAPYYCTEKLMDAFLAKSLPIYWGDNKAVEDFNEKAFINVNRLNRLGISPIDLVKEYDTNDKMFLDTYNQPVFTDIQAEKLKSNMEEFKEWLVNAVKR